MANDWNPCPSCGGSNLEIADLSGHSSKIAVCRDCCAAFEPFRPSDLSDASNQLSPFVRPCDNCAFRKGSPEQADPYQFMRIREALDAGQDFYCHKGVPLTLNGTGYAFQYPDSLDHARKCRGALNIKAGAQS